VASRAARSTVARGNLSGTWASALATPPASNSGRANTGIAMERNALRRQLDLWSIRVIGPLRKKRRLMLPLPMLLNTWLRRQALR
jgi:hypothetical protein